MDILEIIGWVVGGIVGIGALFIAVIWIYIWVQQKKGRNPFM